MKPEDFIDLLGELTVPGTDIDDTFLVGWTLDVVVDGGSTVTDIELAAPNGE